MSLTLSPDAVSQINGIFEENDLSDHVVRVTAEATPGEPLAYELDIVDEVHDTDRIFVTAGIKVVTDPRSWLWIKGTKIGFSADSGGFTFDNPRGF